MWKRLFLLIMQRIMLLMVRLVLLVSYSSKKPSDYLRIEFATQQGVTYSYTKKDFDEETGKASLELAYALTVHKAKVASLRQ